jgi:hypothetical protein
MAKQALKAEVEALEDLSVWIISNFQETPRSAQTVVKVKAQEAVEGYGSGITTGDTKLT